MIKTITPPKAHEYTILKWAGGYDELLDVGQELGRLGVVFSVVRRSHFDSPNEVYPELTILDNRSRSHVATYNSYIVIGPGSHNIRVLDRANYRAEFEGS